MHSHDFTASWLLLCNNSTVVGELPPTVSAPISCDLWTRSLQWLCMTEAVWGHAQGLDNETDCLGHITYTHWTYGEAHPKAFTPDDIDADTCALA